MRVAEDVSKYLPTKHAIELRKSPHLCCLLKGVEGGAQFLQQQKKKSLTTKKVDNFFLCHY